MSWPYESEQEIEQVVRGFETCTTAAADFHHREHLIVAVWYLQTLSPRQAVAKMRASLLQFLDHHGVDRAKYSEDVTVFWVDTVARELEEIKENASLMNKCNQIVERFTSTARTPATRVEGAELLVKS